MLVRIGGEDPAPGIEQHQRIGAVRNLLRQISSDRFCVDRQDAMEEIGTRIEHPTHAREIDTAAAFDHVAGERKRAARETEQRHLATERTLDRSHRVVDITQALGVGYGEPRYRPLVGQRPGKARTFAFDEMQAETHRVGNGQDVGEKNRRVECKTLERLQRHLGGQIGARAKRQEASGAPARRVVLGKVAAGLAHQPDRRVVGRLAPERAEQRIVLQRNHREAWRCAVPPPR